MNNLLLFKQCTKCLQEKLLSEFRKQSSTNDGLQRVCKECGNKKAIEWYKNNSERIKVLVKKWQTNNREKVNASKRGLKINPIYRIRRKLMHSFGKKTKLPSSNSYIGCSDEELKIHIEKQWQKDMTWENYGTLWFITKIKHFSEFDITNLEDVKKANHYSNLKPIYNKYFIQKYYEL